MKNMRLSLKPGVTLAEEKGRAGLTLAGHTQFAQSPEQEAVLRVLYARPETVERLLGCLQSRRQTEQFTGEAALALASFILDFDAYLDS